MLWLQEWDCRSKMKKLSIGIIIVTTLSLGFESIYTRTTNCKTKERQKDVHIIECGNVGNLIVLLEETNRSKSITLVHQGKEYPQKYWASVSYDNILSLGKKIEWRYSKGSISSPIAMIVRVNVNEDEGLKYTQRSYLAVSKITKNEICVVGKIPPQSHQNELARKMAEIASGLPCVLNLDTME